MKPKKDKICKVCKMPFKPFQSFQRCCDIECAIKDGQRKAREAKKRDITKTKREFKNSDKSHLMKIAQQEVNKYIRQRDKNEFCISCKMPPGFRIEAGHYRSAGNNGAIRFHTLNIHAQCHKCNCRLSANLIPYRENLIKKIGITKIEWLESQTQPHKYTVEYLQKLIRVFKKKNKKEIKKK